MSHATARIAFLATMLAVLCLFVSPTRAHAFAGDWSLSGSFERTTTPSFAGGFNPNDLDQLVATYDSASLNFQVVATCRLHLAPASKTARAQRTRCS